jgi:hypothetical protein
MAGRRLKPASSKLVRSAMERCDNCTALEAAYLFALETYAALLYQEVYLHRKGDSASAREYEHKVHRAEDALMAAKGKLQGHRNQEHRT